MQIVVHQQGHSCLYRAKGQAPLWPRRMDWTKDIPTLCALTSVLLLSTRARSYAVVVAVIGLVWFALWHEGLGGMLQQGFHSNRNKRSLQPPPPVTRETFFNTPVDEEDDDDEETTTHVVPRPMGTSDVVGSPDMHLLSQQRLPSQGRNRTKRVFGTSSCCYRSQTGQTSSFGHLR